jgi:hypothetical protein
MFNPTFDQIYYSSKSPPHCKGIPDLLLVVTFKWNKAYIDVIYCVVVIFEY